MKEWRGKTCPYMREPRHITALAVDVKILRHHGRDGHGNPEEAVLIYPDPDDIKPRQSAPRRPPTPPLSAATHAHPGERPHPGPDRLQGAEVVLLGVEGRRGVVAEEGEEGGDGEGLVAVGDDGEVDGVGVEVEGQEAGDGVDGDHEDDPYDTAEIALAMSHSMSSLGHVLPLLPRFRVVQCVHAYRVERDQNRNDRAAARDYQTQLVEVEGAGDGQFGRYYAPSVPH